MSRPSLQERAAMLAHLGPRIREEMLREFTADSCIAATRIGMDVLKAAGVSDSYALSVRCGIANQPMLEHAARIGRLPHDPQETEAWSAEDGSWVIGVGYDGDPRPNRWPGHLVLIVERRILWDLSIDQANRPHRSIVFHGPVLLPVNEAFLRGRTPLIEEWPTPHGRLLLHYEARPADKSFRTSRNWTDDIAHVDVVTIGDRSAR